MAVRVGDASAVPRTLVQVNGDASLGRVSPDGRWLAYTTNISGRQEIWVQGYPTSGDAKPFLVSTEGGRDSVWSRDGKWLYFLSNEHTAMFKVSIQTERSNWGLPEKVCELDPLVYVAALNVPSYDVAPDGRFIFARNVTPQSPLEIRVVLNWFEELKRLVPVKESK